MKCSTECPLWQRSLLGGVCLAGCRVCREDGGFDCLLNDVADRLEDFVKWRKEFKR